MTAGGGDGVDRRLVPLLRFLPLPSETYSSAFPRRRERAGPTGRERAVRRRRKTSRRSKKETKFTAVTAGE